MGSPSIGQWLDRRIADVEMREGLNSLTTIGPDKPLGSRGFPGTVEAHTGIEEVPEPSKGFRLYDLEWGVWVYMWNLDAFPKLLQDHAELLEAEGWPTEAHAFVERIRGQEDGANKIRPRTPLFDLIADVYGDKTNPGRTDCPFPAGRCLRMYYQRTGKPDPVNTYFAAFGLREAQKIQRRWVKKRQRKGAPEPQGWPQ